MLFNPSSFWYTGQTYRINPALGLPILAAVLNNAGHHCEVTDLEALQVAPDRLRQAFAAQKDRWPDVVGVTALTASSRGAQDTITAVREAGFTGSVLVGGVHVTLRPDDALSWGADTVVTGECEGNIVSIVESGTRGIVAGVSLPIDQIPAPAWRVHNPAPNSYGGNLPWLNKPELITMWSRGCPWKCVMCGNAVFGQQRTRYRPPVQIEAELRGLKAYGARSLFVYDDEMVGLPLPTGWAQELADRIEPLHLTWKTQGRCSHKHVTLDLLQTLYRAGCRVIMWGVESFSQPVLNAMRKGTLVEDIWHTLRLAKQAGIKNFIFTMIGSYKEGDDDLAVTAESLSKAYGEGLIDYRQTTIVTAMLGTELAAIQKREGWYVAPPECGPQAAQIYHDTPWLSGQRMLHWLREFERVCPVDSAGNRLAGAYAHA